MRAGSATRAIGSNGRTLRCSCCADGLGPQVALREQEWRSPCGLRRFFVAMPRLAPVARMIELLLTGTTKMRLIFMAPMVAALVGCATTRLSNDVKAYVGRDIHELAARLGNPTGKRETTGTSVYVWSTDAEGVLPTSSGAQGTRTSTMTVQYECTLEVTVNAQSVIQSYQVEGSNAGCAAFRRHLNH
jgi:hypothetical protein